MNRLAVLALSAALACGGSSRTAPPPVPRPGTPPASAGPTPPDARIAYRISRPLRYEISRYDSLVFQGAGSGAAQVTGRRVHLTVRPDGSRLHLELDSLAGVLGPRLTPSTIDSALQTRLEIRIAPTGPSGEIRASRNTVIIGQVAAAVRLLFPQLPNAGLRSGDEWEDSTSYPVRLDAFEAVETAARNSRATPGPAPGSVRVEAGERLTRSGTTLQGGRTMTLSGSGGRLLTYDLLPDGWLSFLRVHDSLELQVVVPDSPAPIPVRWRSTVIARLRGTPPG